MRRATGHAGAAFDAQSFLDSAGVERAIVSYRKGDAVYTQGQPCDTLMYLQAGEITLSVTSRRGKEAIVAVLAPTSFFGEGGLSGQRVRTGTARASAVSTVLVIEQAAMIHLLHEQRSLADRFIAHLLTRNARIEADLVDLLFNSAEKRLARTLLLLARYGDQETPQRVIPKISQQTLADMVGTTRSRVNCFLKRFKKMGFIEVKNGLVIHRSLLSVVLHDRLD